MNLIVSETQNGIWIGDTFVHMDEEGRYCLNDLHKAAGGHNSDKPNLWLVSKQTKALIAELDSEIAGIPAILIKQGLGTFVSRELVYSYAMWLDPKFYLKVIRTFDNVSTGTLNVPNDIHLALIDSLREDRNLLIDQNKLLAETIQSLIGQNSPVRKRKDSPKAEQPKPIRVAKTPKPKKQVEYIGMRELQDKILQVIGGRTYFSFTEITDRVGQGQDRHVTGLLKKLGYETVTRRRINGDRHSIWAKANAVIDIDEAKDTLNFICAML